jgi:signal transduction histidine kinase
MILLTVEIRLEHHVVLARQRARQISGLLGLGVSEQTRVATAVSEIARNALQYGGGGRVQFSVDPGPTPLLTIDVRDRGPGIRDVQAVLDGRYVSRTGMGRGLAGTKLLMDRFEVETGRETGTTVRIGKLLPADSPGVTSGALEGLVRKLASHPPESPLEEVQRQNQELLSTLAELRQRQAEVERLNTSLQAANLELDAQAQELQRVSEAKTRFLRHLSHELRAPLGSALRICHLLLSGEPSLLPEASKQVTLIRRSTVTVADLVNNLLDLAKIEAGRSEVHAAEVRVSDLFAGLSGMLLPLVPSAEVTLAFEEPQELPDLHTDEAKLTHVLRNLITNALKYTERGEVRVRASSGPAGIVVFAVADTGVGIAPEDQGRVFEEFEQVRSSLQNRSKGTGLGLPLARGLAALLGGTLTLRSEPGVGSTFSLTIPAVLPVGPGCTGCAADKAAGYPAASG